MKKAFTMLEVIFVVVIVGILAFTITPKLINNNKIHEASSQILSHIKYTQQLALEDELFDPNEKDWYKKRWSIQFRSCADGDGMFYKVYSNRNKDSNYGSPDESAKDPLNGRSLYNNGQCEQKQEDSSPNVLISQRFGLVAFGTDLNSTCSLKKTLTFDRLGRLHTGTKSSVYEPYEQLVHTDCNITFKDKSNNSFTITILKESGYMFVSNITEQ